MLSSLGKFRFRTTAGRSFLWSSVLSALVLASACKPRSFNSASDVQGLTQQQFDTQFEVTRLSSCKAPNGSAGGELRVVWRVRNSAGQAVTPYILGFSGDAVTTKNKRVRFQIMTAIGAPRPPIPADAPQPFPFDIYRGYELQIPADEAAAKWGYVEVDGKNVSYSSIDAGGLLLPVYGSNSPAGRMYYVVQYDGTSYNFNCDPLDANALARLSTFGIRDGSHGYKGDRGVAVKTNSAGPAVPAADGKFVTQWACSGNRRPALNHYRQPLSGGWLNQEEYCEWDRNGTPPSKVNSGSAKPAQLTCMVRSGFDQNRAYFLQQRLYKPTPEQQKIEGFSSAGEFKSNYYDTKFNGYAFLVGGREGYHVWDSRVWRKMGEKGDPRGAYISDTRKGIIGHCMQYTCGQPDETGYTGNCVEGRQSDPLICAVINSIYCVGQGQAGCKQKLELNLAKRPVVHADLNHVQNSSQIDPVLKPDLLLPPAPLDKLSPPPAAREDVLFRSDYTPPTRLGDTPIKLDLVIPDGLAECKHVVDPVLLKSGRVKDPSVFLANDRTLVQCNFAANRKYNNCDEVASQIQVRIALETQSKR
ncbi:MAG: hypothetical protein EBR09_03135 [Proteobacteria bacterium]|nr:hypothetical protein [Pseudomonadota bacterium]